TYEDPLDRLWRDARGGAVAPAPNELRDPERRRELADRLTNDAAGPPVGYALPLQHDDVHGCWRSGTWVFRRGRLYLLAGTLPMGCGSRSPRRRASTSTLRCSRPHTTRRPMWVFVRNGCSRTARASPSGPALPSSWVERHRKRARSSPDRRSCARSWRTGSDT